jgi:hypothetical protein
VRRRISARVTRLGRVERAQGVENLVGLFEQVRHEGAVRLGPVPRAAVRRVATRSSSRSISRAAPVAPPARGCRARSGDRVAPCGPGPTSRPVTTCSSGRPRWCKSTTSGPGTPSSGKADSFISESRACDQHCATRYGPRSPRYCPCELLRVHQAHARAERVDAETFPGQVQERQGRDDGEVHPGVVAQQLDGAFRHQGRTGHRIDDRAREPAPWPRRPVPPQWRRRPRRTSPPTRTWRRMTRTHKGLAPPGDAPCVRRSSLLRLSTPARCRSGIRGRRAPGPPP